MKINKRINIFVILCLITLICCGLVLLNVESISAETTYNLEDYTNSDLLLDSRYEIQDYLGNMFEPYLINENEVNGLYASTIKKSIYGIEVNGDDLIGKIVPKEIFKKPNEQLVHFGEEYGFFIKTERVDNFILANVIVFDIVNGIDLIENKNHTKFKMQVLFQREFLYAANAGDYIFNTRFFIPRISNGDYFNYELTEEMDRPIVLHIKQSDTIMPLPYYSSNDTYYLCDSQRYYVQDIVSTISLFNEQHLNDGDEGYNVYQDKGKFITQIEGAYQATVYNVNEKDFFTELFKTRLIAGVSDGLKKGAEALGYGGLWAMGEFVSDAYNAYINTADSLEQISREFHYIPQYTTNQDQIEYTGKLSKFALSTLKFENDGSFGAGSFMFYKEDDYYEADYQLGYTSNYDEITGFKTPWETRLVRGFSLKLVNHYNSYDYIETSSFYDILLKDESNPEYVSMDYQNRNQKVSLLPGGKNSFLFFPHHTGSYMLTSKGADSPIRISISQITPGFIESPYMGKVDENNRYFRADIQMGSIYIFTVEYVDKTKHGNFDIELEFKPLELNTGYNNNVAVNQSHYYYKVYSNKNAYCDIKLSEKDWNAIIYDQNFNQIMDGKVNKNEYYYIRIMRSTNINKYISVYVNHYISINFKNIENVTNLESSKYRYYTDSILDLPTPQRKGYIFDGWWTSLYDFGELFTNIDILEYDLPDLTLYAKWQAAEFKVQYVTNGGTSIEAGTYITDNSYQLRTDTFKPGYVLYGWYDNPEFYGNKISVIDKGSMGDKIFYARWIQDKFTANLNVNKDLTDGIEASIENTQFMLEYNQYFSLPVPYISDYDFNGWFYGDIPVTDSSGNSYDKFTFENDIELTASWSPNTYYICMNDDGQLLWLAKDGNGYFFTDKEFGLPKTDDMCPGCYLKQQLSLADNPNTKLIKEKLFKPGHIYLTMALEEKSVITDNSFDEDLCCWKTMNFINSNKNRVISIFPVYALEKYTVLFDMNDDSQNIISRTVFYEDDMTIFDTPTKVGYTFSKWAVKNFANYDTEFEYISKNFPAGQVFPSKMPDLTIGFENSLQPCIMLAPQYTPNVYTISFEGENVDFESKQVFFGKSYSNNDKNALPIPNKIGYDFDGWYDSADNRVSNSLGAVDSWNIPNDCTLFAKYIPKHYQITFDFCGGSGGTEKVEVIYDSKLPLGTAPQKKGYTFNGYFAAENGNGTQYYNIDMVGLANWTDTSSIVLYAYWTAKKYTITIDYGFGNVETEDVFFGEYLSDITNLFTYGYKFCGSFTRRDGLGEQIHDRYGHPIKSWDIDSNLNIYVYWELVNYEVNVWFVNEGVIYNTFKSNIESNIRITSPDYEGYTFLYWEVWSGANKNPTITKFTDRTLNIKGYAMRDREKDLYYLDIHTYYEENCIAEGTMITLADGSQKAVEELTGDEQLLVWNLYTGEFDSAPILFIDKDELKFYKIINLYFSDGTIVKVISEHAFWDFDLNSYVFLRNDAAKYIGHWFNKQITDLNGNMTWGKVQLKDVIIREEKTRAFSPVTYSHLCYYVNGMLSMPGATESFINIFEIDNKTMKIRQQQFADDIAKYGVYTYEEFAQIVPITEEMFKAFNGQYLKVAIGKGLTTIDKISCLIEKYSKFLDK